MSRPGVDVTITGAPARRGVPTSTGRLFLATFAEQGPVGEAVLVSSVAAYEETFGARVSYGAGYDYLDAFFNTGGADAQVTRAVGPNDGLGSSTVVDKAGTPLSTLRFDAKYPGSYSTRIKRQIAAGSSGSLFTIVILFDDVEVERYTDLASPAAAVTALADSDFVTLVNMASVTVAPNNNPATAGAAALSAGTDDHSNATDADWAAALTAFGAGLGPGQVAYAGNTSAAGHAALQAHAKANNRFALTDADDLDSETTLKNRAAVDAAVVGPDFAGPVAPHLIIPGLTAGTTRIVQASAVAAGLLAASDAVQSTGNAAAGEPFGDAGGYVLGLSGKPFTDVERAALDAAGVNVFRVGPNGVQLYSNVTVSADPTWKQMSWARLRMEIQFELVEVAGRFVFRPLTRGTISDFRGAQLAVLHRHYDQGVLYGLRPEDAYNVLTDASINTPTTIAAGELRSHVEFSMTPTVVHVDILATKVAITTSIAA